MPRILPLVLTLSSLSGVLSIAPRTSAADDLDGEIFLGTLEEDDLADERAWLDPLDARPGMLGVSLRGAIARWIAPIGPAMRVELGLIVHLPLDRLLGTTGRPVSMWNERRDPAELGMGAAVKTKHARWGTLAALPGAIALGGVATAKEKGTSPSVSTSTSTSPSTSTTTSVSASAKSSSSVAPKIATGEAPQVAGTQVATAPPLVPPGALRALVTAAWHTAGLDRDEALDDLASRAKSSALAPELRLRAHRTLSYGARIFSADTLADHTTLSDGTETFLEARLTWRLDRLVFADEEVGIERVKLDRAELKQRVSSRIVELTIAWSRARRAAQNPDLLPVEREEAAMTAMEAILALDAFTGGAATELLHP